MERNNRNAWIGFGVPALLILVGLSTLGAGMMGNTFAAGHMYGDGWAFRGPWMWGIGAFGLLVRVLVWGALILWAVRFFRRAASGRADHIGHSDVSAVQILKRRYASGEITREQYDDMRSVLESPEA